MRGVPIKRGGLDAGTDSPKGKTMGRDTGERQPLTSQSMSEDTRSMEEGLEQSFP